VASLSAHLGRRLQLIAESDLNDPRVVARREGGGHGMDAQWSDDFHHALHTVLTGERDGYYADFGTLAQLATALRRAFVYAGTFSPHRGRVHGREPVGIPGWRFLGYLEDHDQIGNRARGDRVTAGLSPGRVRAGAALVACAPFVPMLFMGEEWGTASPFPYFVDHADPALAQAVREGRRREFAASAWSSSVPDPQDPETAASAVLDWREPRLPAHAEVLRWWTDLLALRRRRAELTDGRLDRVVVDFDESARWLVLRRGGVAVAVNLGPAPASVPVGPGTVVLSHGLDPVPGDAATLVLPPDGVVVVEA
jgi:maltooligosyltrehalose trehalohydrolase